MGLDREPLKIAELVKLRRDPETEPSYRRMTMQEIQREGRLDEYHDWRRRVLAEEPEWSGQKVQTEAFRRMGLGDSSERVRKYREFHEMLDKEGEAEAEDLAIAEAERLALLGEFERVFRSLPLEADFSEVERWIKSHPAMNIPRVVGEDGTIEITAEDIRDAPSRSAVGQLTHWVNKKDEFYKLLMTNAGRAGKGSGKESTDTMSVEEIVADMDPSLGALETMLGEIGC